MFACYCCVPLNVFLSFFSSVFQFSSFSVCTLGAQSSSRRGVDKGWQPFYPPRLWFLPFSSPSAPPLRTLQIRTPLVGHISTRPKLVLAKIMKRCTNAAGRTTCLSTAPFCSEPVTPLGSSSTLATDRGQRFSYQSRQPSVWTLASDGGTRRVTAFSLLLIPPS